MIGSWRDIPLFGLAVVTTGTCSVFTQLKCALCSRISFEVFVPWFR